MLFINTLLVALTKLSKLSDRLVPLFLSMAVLLSMFLLAFNMIVG